MSSRCRELGLCVLCALALTGCKREERRFSEPGGASIAPHTISLSDIQPGGATPRKRGGSPYDYNAYAISQGKQLYEWFNCSGCHAHGGGAIGPALMDDWNDSAYGSAVYALMTLHTIHLITDFADTIVLAVLMFTGPLQGKRFVDVSENALYWWFVVISWLFIYATVYLAPRMI